MNHEHDIQHDIMRREKGLASQLAAVALDRLKAIHPVRIVALRHGSTVGGAQDRWDGEVTLKTDQGAFRYAFEVKTHLRPQTVQHLWVQANLHRKLRGRPHRLLLFADYVNPTLAQQLKHDGINFIDTAGNVFLEQGRALHLYVEGKKPRILREEKPVRLFQPSGLTLLFGLLVTPESVNWSYRDLARTNNVALGTVGWIMRDLREQGYVEPRAKNKLHLTRKKDLLARWVEGYAMRLRPKILVGEFVDPTRDLETVVEGVKKYAGEQQIHWGLTGGFGAFELLHHYRGKTLSVVVEKWRAETALVALHLLPAEGGDVRVFRSFAPTVFTEPNRATGYPAVHPLLVYAELLLARHCPEPSHSS
jgi:hypothetical protein